MSRTTFPIDPPGGFRLRTVVHSHGWYDLPPFEWSPDAGELRFAALVDDQQPVSLAVRQPRDRRLQVEALIHGRWTTRRRQEVDRIVRRVLGLADDLAEFHRSFGRQYAWAKRLDAGRLLRSPSAFEDVVRILATTNCSWSATRGMIGRLVEHLGPETPDGRRAFPSARAMADQPVEFYRDVVRSGYRARHFASLSSRVADGLLVPDDWERFEGSTEQLVRRIREVPGLGRYAAESLCKLFGRFDGLALDSWCLQKFQKIHGPQGTDVEQAIRDHYEPYGRWRGLALWLDLTRDWHEAGVAADASVSFDD